MAAQRADILNAAATAVIAENKTKLLTGIDARAAISNTTGTGAVISN